jgi:hypothetical protein
LYDLLSLMDRGFVFNLIKHYCNQVSAPQSWPFCSFSPLPWNAVLVIATLTPTHPGPHGTFLMSVPWTSLRDTHWFTWISRVSTPSNELICEN